MQYLHGHLEGEVGLWKETEVKDKLKDWRMSQSKPVVSTTAPVTTTTTSESPIIISEPPIEDLNKKRNELANKMKMIPSAEVKEIVNEIIEKENGVILDILLKYVQ